MGKYLKGRCLYSTYNLCLLFSILEFLLYCFSKMFESVVLLLRLIKNTYLYTTNSSNFVKSCFTTVSLSKRVLNSDTNFYTIWETLESLKWVKFWKVRLAIAAFGILSLLGKIRKPAWKATCWLLYFLSFSTLSWCLLHHFMCKWRIGRHMEWWHIP